MLHIGLVINPLAGLGGSLALKGSDGDEIRVHAAQADSASPQRAALRAERALRQVVTASAALRFSCAAGPMGQDSLQRVGLPCEICDEGPVKDGITDADNTRSLTRALLAQRVDIILFAGGDGTARDIYDVVGGHFPVLGIPAGVKMHSGVFAVSPEAAGELLCTLASGGLVGLRQQEVRDIDEQAFRHGVVKSRHYGDMQVPGEGRYLQHTKVGGRESQELVAAEIAAWVVESMQPGHTYFIGPGSTTAAIMQELNLPNTLLGVDVVRNRQLLLTDADEHGLLAVLADDATAQAHLIVTVIEGQGIVFGRGNQQFSPAVIRAAGLENVTIVATKSKIAALQGRPLLVDTDDPELDEALRGYRAVIAGYDDQILYPVGLIG